MQARDFCFWLQGFVEMTPAADRETLTASQMQQLRRHLELVFKHDPTMAHEAPRDPIVPSPSLEEALRKHLNPHVTLSPAQQLTYC